MKIVYSAKAERQLQKLPKREQIKILKKIIILETEPFFGKKLKGKFKGLLSFKIWPYRVIYQLKKKLKTIFIVAIEHRQKVYK